MDPAENENVIPTEDFQLAIAECRRDPGLDSYFANAPAGAKLFIGLQFYGTVFADVLDEARYLQCRSEIEPDLSPEDLDYLLAHVGDDAQTAAYLQGLRDRIGSPRMVAPALQRVPTQRMGAPASAGPTPPPRLRSERVDPPRTSPSLRERILKAAVLVAVLSGMLLGVAIVWFQMHAKPSDSRGRESGTGETAAAVTNAPAPSESLDAVRARLEREAADARERLARLEREVAAERERKAQEKAREENLAAQREAEEAGKAASRERHRQVARLLRSALYDFREGAGRPEAEVAAETVFHYLLPGEEGGCELHVVLAGPGHPPEVQWFPVDGVPEEVPYETFARRRERSVHLLLQGDRAFLCSAPGREASVLRVPPKGEAFNPFREELGAFYDGLMEQGVRNPPLAYDVFFQPRDGSPEVAVGAVYFGDGLSHRDFSEAIARWMARRTAEARRARAGVRRRLGPPGAAELAPFMPRDSEVEGELRTGRVVYRPKR